MGTQEEPWKEGSREEGISKRERKAGRAEGGEKDEGNDVRC